MKTERMAVKELAEQSRILYDKIEAVMMEQETPDIVYIAVLSRHICECLVATGASKREAMEKLGDIYDIVQAQEREFVESLGSSTSIN